MEVKTKKTTSPQLKPQTWVARAGRDLRINYYLYFMVLPVVAYYIIFAYIPMYGVTIAFKEYSPRLGILGSPWVGLKHVQSFLSSPYFGRVFLNTINISLTSLVFGFPAPIILALLINELKNKSFTRITQTITYLPHFVSLVVICGMIKSFTRDDGLINDLIFFFGGERVTMLNNPNYFLPIYIISGLWQEIGWGSIIYLSALTAVDPELYDAAMIDGAGRWRQTLNVTLPGILPTVIILLILRVGSLIGVGHEKVLLLANDATWSKADVIATYVYRRGLAADLGANQWSYSTAIGLFNTIINLVLLIITNTISRKISETSLW